MALLDVLNGILSGLTAQLTSSSQPAPGALVHAQLSALPAQLDATDVVNGDLDLTFVGKDVMYSTADLEPSLGAAGLNAATLGPKPITGATGIIGGIIGTPGLLGQLKGTLPLPVQGSFPVQASVQWHVLDDAHNPLPATEFSAPGGLTGTSVAVAFAPATTELTDAAPPPPQQRFLRASVTLTAGSVTTPSRDLPDLPIVVPALPIPTVLALFLHTNFEPRQNDDDGAALIVVPQSSPLRSVGQLQGVLNTLQSAVGNLTAFGSFASFLLGLGDLVQAVAVQPAANVQFRAADSIANLNDITLIQRGFFENDTEAEDELSSLILIGREGRGVRCSNDRNDNAGQGQFTVTTTANLFAVIRDLDGTSPNVEGGAISVGTVPPGGLFTPNRFNDELSSIVFV